MKRHTYEAAEKFILSREFFGMKLGLENITEFLISIGSPQLSYPTIHISGTNGKGSTAAMLASILKAQGYKTGLFTSPHLISLRERIRVNDRFLPEPSLTAFINRHRLELTRRKLSFFELVCAMALDHFARVHVDIAVIETGLGGRLDASNVLQPILTITTGVSKDHMEILGSRISTIAGEKAGIIKKGVPHLIGHMPDSAVNVFKKRCTLKKSRLFQLNKKEYTLDKKENHLHFHSRTLKMNHISCSLEGIHQLQNAALTVKATEILNRQSCKISNKAIRAGLKQTRWPGRFQILPQRGKPVHIFDVAHNVEGVTAFVDSFQKRYPGKKAYILTGFVKRKEHQKIFDQLAKISQCYAITPLNTKRSTDVAELMWAINFKDVPTKCCGSLNSAYNYLLKNCSKDDILIILGSHYLVGEFFKRYNIRWR